jgi:hypothetical protein
VGVFTDTKICYQFSIMKDGLAILLLQQIMCAKHPNFIDGGIGVEKFIG